MSWMRSGTKLSQFLRDFLPTLVKKTCVPNMIKSFDVTEDSPDLFTSIKSFAKSIIETSKLVHCRVSRYETRLKRRQQIIITKVIE